MIELTVVQFLFLLLIAGICGGIGQALVGYSRGGCFVAIGVGFVGALLGTWLAGQMGLPEPFVIQVGDQPFPVIWAIVGSALFVAAISLVTQGTRRVQRRSSNIHRRTQKWHS